MSEKLGDRLAKIAAAREKEIPTIPNSDTQMIIKIIEDNSETIEKYFQDHPKKDSISSDDLEIENLDDLIAYVEYEKYWQHHSKYIQDYFQFKDFYIHVEYDYDIAKKSCYDGDGYVSFRIYI